MRWGTIDMEANPRPILNTQPVFLFASKITRFRERGPASGD
jgi:hypothetical protein